MNYCPLMSYAKQYAQEIPCLGENCAMAADGAGECLIKQALQIFVGRERTKLAEEEERIRHETDLAKMYWAMKKGGIRGAPAFFLEDVEPTPADLSKLQKPRHGGAYDDLTELREKYAKPAQEVDFGPPRIENHSMNI